MAAAARLALGAALLAAGIGCRTGAPSSSSSTSEPGESLRRPVWLVNDRLDVEETAVNEVSPGLVRYYFDNDVARPLWRSITLKTAGPARNVNAVGGVPDSTWFRNRIGRHPLSPADLRHGPGQGGPPRAPFEVTGTKVGGAAVGLMVRDADGDRYLLKFDRREEDEAETAAAVVTQRLYWAFGYHVPDDDIVTFPCSSLRIAGDATIENRRGDKRPLTTETLDGIMQMVRSRRGQCRALASKLVDGKPLGGFAPHGVREGDRNDRVPHQLRRDLRGEVVLASWLDRNDVKRHNTLDVLIEDPQIPGHHYVKHYRIDFGQALGVFADIDDQPRLGFYYFLDWGEIGRSLATMGLWKRAWRGFEDPGIPGVGRFDAEHFDPDRWHSSHPWYPFQRADRFDRYWATTIIMRFSPEHIRAAVDAGRYRDPRAREYLVRTLIARQREIGRTHLSRVTPLDELELSSDRRLCFVDLWVRYRFGRAKQARYFVRRRGGDRLRAIERRDDGRICTTVGPGDRQLRIDVVRRERWLEPVYVTIGRDRRGAFVAAIDRRGTGE